MRGFVLDGPGAPGTDRIVPDLVLFVNGVPLVVIEAKSPHAASPMATAIDQLRRYANQRGDVRADEGNEKLFHTNQFVIAAHGTNARAAGFTAGPEHFMEWKTTEPATGEQVAAELDLTGPDAAKDSTATDAGRRDAAPGPSCSTWSDTSPCSWRPTPAGSRSWPATSSTGPSAAPSNAWPADHPAPARGDGPTRRHRLAHPRLRQEPDHGVPWSG